MSTFGDVARRSGVVLLAIVNIVVCASMVVSAYAGTLNPADNGWAVIAVLMMPVCLGILILTAIIDAFVRWRWLFGPLLTMLVTLGPIYDLCPVSVLPAKVAANAKKFTLLTYNVATFSYGKQAADSLNSTLQYLIDSHADVICLQEDVAQYGLKYAYQQLADNQLDSLHALYPYHYENDHGQTLLSRYEAYPIEDRQFIVVYRLNIDGHSVTLINVHLRSLGLSIDDRELYSDLSTLKKPELGARATVSTVRHELLAKIAAAYRQRGEQANMLAGLIKKYGGPDVILTGDFNDVPGCYTLRKLEDSGMRQVYPAVGNGYRYTFHENHMYFRIDHMLWRGDMQPVSLTCEHVPYSDHYPQLATFAFTGGS